jgi:hypothetical protein
MQIRQIESNWKGKAYYLSDTGELWTIDSKQNKRNVAQRIKQGVEHALVPTANGMALRSVCRMVAECFISNPKKHSYVRKKDYSKPCCADNVEWVAYPAKRK